MKKKQNNPKFNYVSVQKLKGNKRNPRKHSQSQIEMLKESINKFGFLNPVIIDEKMNVIAGHGRLSAARELGMKEVPAITAPNLTQKQKDALMIADNKISAESYWDNEMLAEILEELDGDDEIFTAFSDTEIGELLSELESNSSKDNSGAESVVLSGQTATEAGQRDMKSSAEQYSVNGYRNIIVILDEEQYATAIDLLHDYCTSKGFKNNSDAIYNMIIESK